MPIDRASTHHDMKDYQRQFLEFTLDVGVLCFGEFTLKSGRISPYFFNAGLFNSGERLARVGEYYAAAAQASGIDFDMVYGPAYKGIPLACCTAIALARQHHRDLPYAFNRKEAKKHAEGGIIVGAPLSGKVLIVDDVISSGMSIKEAIDIILAQGAAPAGVVIALDRQELGEGKTSAIQEIEDRYGVKVTSIASLDLLIKYLQEHGEDADPITIRAMQTYRDQYGVSGCDVPRNG